jgi:glucose/arabinose dehydrogenase
MLVLAGPASAAAYSFRPIASGFTDPVYVTTAPGDPSTLYVVEQVGTIQIVRGGRVAATFLDLRSQVLARDELGLLSMAFHPRYAQNHLFYVDYTDLNGDTHVVEYRADGGVAVPSSARELLFVDQPYPNHKGGQLEFDRKGFLYVGMGDGGTNPDNGPTGIGDPENRAQNPDSMLGKLLRIDPTTPGATWQIVGYGLRNPWRFSFDRLTGDLWIGDVGAARFEEIDHRPLAQLGVVANYGWSRLEGRSSYNPKIALGPGRPVAPSWVYTHDYGNCGVIGGYVYRGKRLPAARGRYVFGDLCTGSIWTLKVGKGGRLSGLASAGARIPNLSSFGEDGNGELYALSLNGVLYALR